MPRATKYLTLHEDIKAHGLASYFLFGCHMEEIDDETMLFCLIILERELIWDLLGKVLYLFIC